MDVRPISIVSREPVPASILGRITELYRAYLTHVPAETLRDLAIRRLGALTKSRDCLVIVLRERGAMRGFGCWRMAREDSELFGVAVPRVEMMIAHADNAAKSPLLTELLSAS